MVLMVESGDLFKIRYNFKSTLQKFRVEALEVFTDVTNFVDAFVELFESDFLMSQ